jgi:hypothetical protein
MTEIATYKKLYCVRLDHEKSLCGEGIFLRYLSLIKWDVMCPKCQEILLKFIKDKNG